MVPWIATGKATLLFLGVVVLTASAGQAAGNGETAAPAPAVKGGGAAAPLAADIAAARATAAARPDDAAAKSRLGTLLLRQGAYDEALRVFAEALALNPRSGEARIGTGAALARKGEMEKAEQVLKEALKSPDPVRAHYELGLIHERRGEFGPAVAEFKEGIRKSQQGRR